MDQKFYIAINGQQVGPFSYEELKAKAIRHETLIWTEGLDKWTKAEDIALLKEILRATPPPLPKEEKKQQIPPIPPPFSKPPLTGKYFGYELATKSERFFASLIVGIISLIITLIFDKNEFGTLEHIFSFESIAGSTIISAILGAIFYSMWSGNLGHKILGLKVISALDGQDENNALKGARREALKSIFGLVIIPSIWLLWDKDKQNLYDKVVNTYVVKKK